MPEMSDANSSGDSSELEALFDSISGGADLAPPRAAAPVAAARPTLMQQARESDSATDDSQDLQALFDSIAEKLPAPAEAPRAVDESDGSDESADWPVQGKVFNQVGQMARQLHDTLGALGYDKLLEETVSALPDAKDRLTYIANLTEQAACKVLNATDIANPLLDELEAGASALDAKWDRLYANTMGVDEFRLLAAETRSFLKSSLPKNSAATKAQLMEIMMAQDFQDLTGQVIKKVVGLAQALESQLMEVLIETMPGEKRTESVNSLLNGPVINAEGRTDVVGTQQQVDDLLDSLGF
jgi:chemotaxis protein CheZ